MRRVFKTLVHAISWLLFIAFTAVFFSVALTSDGLSFALLGILVGIWLSVLSTLRCGNSRRRLTPRHQPHKLETVNMAKVKPAAGKPPGASTGKDGKGGRSAGGKAAGKRAARWDALTATCSHAPTGCLARRNVGGAQKTASSSVNVISIRLCLPRPRMACMLPSAWPKLTEHRSDASNTHRRPQWQRKKAASPVKRLTAGTERRTGYGSGQLGARPRRKRRRGIEVRRRWRQGRSAEAAAANK